MKDYFLDTLARARARSDFTGEHLLEYIGAYGGGQGDLYAGPLILRLVDPGSDIPRVDYCGVTANSLYAISVWEPDQHACYSPLDAYVLAYYLPFDALEEAHVVTLIDWSVRKDRLASDVWSQLHRVEAARLILNGVLCKVVDAAVEAALLAVAAHVSGQRQGQPPPVLPILSDEIRFAVVERVRPQARIVETKWFTDGEIWTAPAFGGTVVVLDAESSNDTPHFLGEGPVTLNELDVPPGFVQAARNLTFQPLEPEEANAFFARYFAGGYANEDAKQRTCVALASWLDVLHRQTIPRQ